MNFKEREAVEFKGTGRGLILYINRETSMENIFDSISAKIKSSPNFFIGGMLTDIDSNYISPYQKKLIIEFLSENYNIEYVGVDEFQFNEMMKQKEYKGAAAIYKAVRTLYVMDSLGNEEIDYNGSVVFMTTVPAGSVIKSSCDIVILGSVDVGAKVIAGGNITVMGEIRGEAYAGAYGNDSACIIARQINAQKIAIFDRESEIVMCKRRTSMSNPEIAYINEEGQIDVSQKKEILYKYSPESIKDTSYGAFDVKEQGVMMEKNQSFNDLAYEIKYSSGTDRIISKEELEEDYDEDYYDEFDEIEETDTEENLEEEDSSHKSGILESIIKKVTESIESSDEDYNDENPFDSEVEAEMSDAKKIRERNSISETAGHETERHNRRKTVKRKPAGKKSEIRKTEIKRPEIRKIQTDNTDSRIPGRRKTEPANIEAAKPAIRKKPINKRAGKIESEIPETGNRISNKTARKNADKIRVVKSEGSGKTSGEGKKKKLVEKLKDLLIEEEVDNEEDRL